MKKARNGFIKDYRYFFLMAVIALGLITTVGSNGGGGDGGSAVTPEPPASSGEITPSSAPQSATAISNINTGLNAAMLPMDLDLGSNACCPKTIINHVKDLLFPMANHKGSTSLASYSGRQEKGFSTITESCSDEGSVTINLTWDGPTEYTDCSQAQDPIMELIFANCREDSMTMDGTCTMSYLGDLCTENPEAFSMDFSSFRYQDPVEESDLTLDITMNLNGIQYDLNDYIAGMALSLDGSMSGFLEGTSTDMNFGSWTATVSTLTYDTSGEMVQGTITIDGSFSGTIDGDQFNESYDDIVCGFQTATVNSVSGELITLDGRYKGACLDGWVTIETIESIFWPESSDCPTSGQVKISGNGEATIAYHSDGSVTVSVGGQQVNYASCDDLPPCI